MAWEWAQWVSRAPLSLAIIICIVQICYQASNMSWLKSLDRTPTPKQVNRSDLHKSLTGQWCLLLLRLHDINSDKIWWDFTKSKKEWWHPAPPLSLLSLIVNMSPSVICSSRRDLLSRYFRLHQRLLSHSDTKCHLTKLLKRRKTCL